MNFTISIVIYYIFCSLFHCLDWPGYKDINIVNNKMLYRLHGNINQAERMEVFHNFIDTKCGVMFCTVYIYYYTIIYYYYLFTILYSLLFVLLLLILFIRMLQLED